MKGRSHSSANQSEPGTSQSETSNQSLQRGSRGTRLRETDKSQGVGQKIPIEFDKYQKPIGPHAIKYKRFVAEQARKMSSILIEKWKGISNDVKEDIWKTIQLTYDVPESDALYKKTMTYCGERWTKFKTNLAKNYVHIKMNDGEPRPDPCRKYSYLDQETWQEFCRIRTTPEALQKREIAQEIGKKNDCPHIMSSGGYEKAEKELMAAKRKRLEDEAEFNPSVLLSPPSPISREQLWLYSRQRRNGSYTSEQTRIVAERIEELQKKQADGSFVSDGRNDILTVAIGKQEHPGRVRGIGGGVGIKDYFGSSKRRSSNAVTRVEMEHLLVTMRDEATTRARTEVEASMAATFQAQMSKLKEEMSQGQRAEIEALMTARAEAEASIAATYQAQMSKMKEEMFQGQRAEVKALMTARAEAEASVAMLQAQMSKMKEEMMIVNSRQETSVPITHSEQVVKSKLNTMQQISLMAYDASFECRFWPVDEVVGIESLAMVDKGDLLSLIGHQAKLTGGIVQVFLMYMHRSMVSSGKINDFGFMCPNQITDFGTIDSLREEYILKRLIETDPECYLAPYNHDDHWQLVLLCKTTYTVVVLCSTHYKVGKDLKKTMNSAMKGYLKKVGDGHADKVVDPNWIVPKTRRQPIGSNLCGFYVMRHIYDIITQGTTAFTKEMFQNSDPFTEEDIEFIRKCCCEFICERIKSEQ